MLNKLDLSTKFILVIIFSVFIMLFFSKSFINSQLDSAMHDLLQISKDLIHETTTKQIEYVKKNESEKLEHYSRILQNTVADLVVNRDIEALEQLADVILSNTNVAIVQFFAIDDALLTHRGAKLGNTNNNSISKIITKNGHTIGRVVIRYRQQDINGVQLQIKANSDANIEKMYSTSRASLTRVDLIMLALTLLVSAGLAVFIAVLFNRLIKKRLQALEYGLKNVSEGDGDLTQEINAYPRDMIGHIAYYYNIFVGKIRKAIHDIIQSSEVMSSSASTLRLQISEAKNDTDKQCKEINRAATAVEQMSSSVSDVAQNAETAAQSSKDVEHKSQQGLKVVKTTISSISELATEVDKASSVIHQLDKDSESISVILDVIRGIAEQTNLLALNAAIEAARAGEQGRGFAVVADEVRTLASRTQQSTAEIHSMIEKLQLGTRNAVQVMENSRDQAKHSVDSASQAGESLSAIVTAIKTINTMNIQIADVAKQQGEVSNEIKDNLLSIKELSSNSEVRSGNIMKSANEVDELSTKLNEIVHTFKV